MSALTLNFDEAEGHLILRGDVAQAARYPLVKNLISQYQGELIDKNTILIPCAQGNLDALNRLISKVLGQYNIPFEYGKNLSQAMEDVKRREKNFQEFSIKAEAIWNNQYDAVEFSDFIARVKQECPGRRFYDLQILSAYHLAFSQYACNFSVPGAGKTSVVYAAYAYLNSLGPDHDKFVDHILVVGPLSSFKAWEDEFKKIFLRSPIRKRLSGGVDSAERTAYLRGYAPKSGQTELTLSHYQTLASNEEDFEAFLQAQSRRTMMVLDEGHKIKRPDGIWASSALRLASFAEARVVLTGTPAPNGYEDLSNLFGFLYPERNVIGFNNAVLTVMSANLEDERIEIMKGRIRPFFTRIRKRDLNLGIPEEQDVKVEPGQIQKEIYSRIERAIVPRLKDKTDQVAEFLTRARLMRLRQAATNPSLLLRPLEDELELTDGIDPLADADRELLGMIKSFDPLVDLAKLDRLFELVTELQETHSKILIWSIFIRNLELIEDSMKSKADWVRTISGSTPVGNDNLLPEDEDIETRERKIDEFLSCKGTAILIANPQVIGESISLHSACHVAIYFDRDFNAGQFIQSKDRIHRYGLPPDATTEYYYLTVTASVEEDIHARLAEKESRLNDLIDKDDIPLFSSVLGGEEEREDIKTIIANYDRRKSG